MRKHMQGITLIELMIVVVILAIIVTVAYPNYRSFAARAKRNEAKAALLQIATNQERFYLNNQRYSNDLTELGFGLPNNFVTETGSYMIRITSSDAAQYTADALYQLPDDEAAKCGTFTINSAGNKGSAPYTDCWTRTR